MNNTQAIEIKAQILNSSFASQKEHYAKDFRAQAIKTLDMKAFQSEAKSMTQSEIIDNMLIAHCTLEMIADALVTFQRFDKYEKALKRVKRHVADFDKHFKRDNRTHVEIARK
jgi:ATP adenylyltransferase/5',5'''-P-1,P-4-tetraphosphate phosphorylase II